MFLDPSCYVSFRLRLCSLLLAISYLFSSNQFMASSYLYCKIFIIFFVQVTYLVFLVRFYFWLGASSIMLSFPFYFFCSLYVCIQRGKKSPKTCFQWVLFWSVVIENLYKHSSTVFFFFVQNSVVLLLV